MQTPTIRDVWVGTSKAYAVGSYVDNTLYLELGLDQSSDQVTSVIVNSSTFYIDAGVGEPVWATPPPTWGSVFRNPWNYDGTVIVTTTPYPSTSTYPSILLYPGT